MLDFSVYCRRKLNELILNTGTITIILPDRSEITLSFEEFEASIVHGLKKRGYPLERTQDRTSAILDYFDNHVVNLVGSENDL